MTSQHEGGDWLGVFFELPDAGGVIGGRDAEALPSGIESDAGDEVRVIGESMQHLPLGPRQEQYFTANTGFAACASKAAERTISGKNSTFRRA